MRKQRSRIIRGGGILLCIAIGVVFYASRQGSRNSHSEAPGKKLLDDAGVQIELPLRVPFFSSSEKRILIMWRPKSRAPVDEPEYLVKVYVRRVLKPEYDSNMRMAVHPLIDDFNRWRCTNHAVMDIRKHKTVWYVRKDLKTPGDEWLFIDCDLQVTESIEKDLVIVEQIVKSVTPLR